MTRKVAEAVDGFGEMDVSQITFNRYLVTSWRNDETNGHVVDISEPSCTCEDFTLRCEGEQVCAHLIKANNLADARPDTSEHVMRFLSQEAQAVQDAAQSIEQTATSIEAYQQGGGSQPASAPAEDDSSEEVEDPVGSMEALLRDAGLDPDAFDVWVDDQFGSLQISQEGYLDDDDFGVWVRLKEDLAIQYDPDSEHNYIKPEDFPEVLG